MATASRQFPHGVQTKQNVSLTRHLGCKYSCQPPIRQALQCNPSDLSKRHFAAGCASLNNDRSTLRRGNSYWHLVSQGSECSSRDHSGLHHATHSIHLYRPFGYLLHSQQMLRSQLFRQRQQVQEWTKQLLQPLKQRYKTSGHFFGTTERRLTIFIAFVHICLECNGHSDSCNRTMA